MLSLKTNIVAQFIDSRQKEYILLRMPVVLYDCEIWSLTLREECRLRVFENRILRQICGPRGMLIRSGEDSTI